MSTFLSWKVIREKFMLFRLSSLWVFYAKYQKKTYKHNSKLRWTAQWHKTWSLNFEIVEPFVDLYALLSKLGKLKMFHFKLYGSDSAIFTLNWDQKLNQKCNDEPHLGGTTFLIMVSPVPGKYEPEVAPLPMHFFLVSFFGSSKKVNCAI